MAETAIPEMLQLYREKVAPALREKRAYRNPHEVPRITKVVLNCSVGSAQDVKVALDEATHDIRLITGQQPVRTKAKKSISNFKIREDQEIGLKVTLRGRVMYEFLLRLIRFALPAIRDFRGVSARAFDGCGNYTLGVKDHTIFPEIELDKVKRGLGFDISIVTTAGTNQEAKDLLELLGMPFVKPGKQ